MKRTTIVLPDDLSELVEHDARRQAISVSEWIRLAIRKAVLGGETGSRRIPWAGLFEDPAMVHGRDVESELQDSACCRERPDDSAPEPSQRVLPLQ